MIRTPALATIFLLAACGAGQQGREVTLATPPLATAAAPASASAPVVAAPPDDPTPFHREDDLLVKVAPANVKKTRLPFAGSSGATWAPDGKTYFVDTQTPTFSGGVLVSDAHPGGVTFATKEIHDVRFSPGGKYALVLDDEMSVVSVMTVPDGTVLGRYTDAQIARFLGDDALLYRAKCSLMKVDLSHPTDPPKPVGPDTCGGADASDDGAVWLVASPSPARIGVMLSMRPYDLLQRIDARTGTVTEVARAASKEAPITDIRLAPPGNRVCFRAKMMQCFELSAGVPKVIPKPNGDPYSLTWDERGEQFLTTGAGELIWVDMRSRQVRTVGLRESIRYWGFLPGGKKIYAYDKGAWIVDLASGAAVEVYPKSVEVGGFQASPKGDRFLIGNEIGAARQYDMVEITP